MLKLRDDLTTQKAEVKKLTDAAAETDAKAKVDAKIFDGHCPPTMRDSMVSLMLKDPAMATDLLNKMPVPEGFSPTTGNANEPALGGKSPDVQAMEEIKVIAARDKISVAEAREQWKKANPERYRQATAPAK